MVTVTPSEALFVPAEPKGLLVTTSAKTKGWAPNPKTEKVSEPPPCPRSSRFNVADIRHSPDKLGMANSNQSRNFATFELSEVDVTPAKKSRPGPPPLLVPLTGQKTGSPVHTHPRTEAATSITLA